jgi:hypothetical protein
MNLLPRPALHSREEVREKSWSKEHETGNGKNTVSSLPSEAPRWNIRTGVR